MRTIFIRVLALIAFALFATHALADNWKVSRLRGQVFQQVGGAWQPLRRGGSIPDDRLVQTGPNGHVALVRGKETIELQPNSEIHIFDKAGAKPFTTVQHHFGTVSIEAEVRNVEHFAVRNKYLAAVVKGTKFTVTSGETGASVEVKRGQVHVEDAIENSTTLIVAGQQAGVEKGSSMTVSGKGSLPPVLAKNGKPIVAAAPMSPRPAAKAADALKIVKASDDPKAIKKAEDVLAKAKGEPKHGKPGHDAAKAAKDQAKADKDQHKEAEKAEKDSHSPGGLGGHKDKPEKPDHGGDKPDDRPKKSRG